MQVVSLSGKDQGHIAVSQDNPKSILSYNAALNLCPAFSVTLSLPPLAPLITTWVAYPTQVDYAFLLLDYSWQSLGSL